MALRRQIASCLSLLALIVVLLGCGSSDEPKSAKIDPATANDFTQKLDLISGYVQTGDCDKADTALGFLEQGADDVSSDTGQQFTADFKDLLSQLGDQIATQCQPAEAATTSSTATTSIPETTEPTEPAPTETSTTTTDPETTTTQTTTTDPVPPEDNPGNGPPVTPPGQEEGGGSGGVSPGFEPGRTGEKKPKHGKPEKTSKDEGR